MDAHTQQLYVAGLDQLKAGKIAEAADSIAAAFNQAPHNQEIAANLVKLLAAFGKTDIATNVLRIHLSTDSAKEHQFLSSLDEDTLAVVDPTLIPPPSYSRQRADAVLGEAFRRCFEYVTFTKVDGDFLEFGTFRGYTARLMASLIREFKLAGNLYLFDSFEGLPEITSPIDKTSYEVVNNIWYHGEMRVKPATEKLIENSLSTIIPRSKLRIVKGYYSDTLDAHLPRTKAAVVHVDCDLYLSAKLVLEKLLEYDMLQDGTVILFDDYNCNHANPNMGERRALREAFGAQRRFTCSSFFSYGWGGHAFFVHDGKAVSY